MVAEQVRKSEMWGTRRGRRALARQSRRVDVATARYYVAVLHRRPHVPIPVPAKASRRYPRCRH